MFELPTQGIILQSLRNQGLGNLPPLPLPLALSLLSALSPSNRAILPTISITRSEVIEVALELGAPCACHHKGPLLSMRTAHVQKKLLMPYVFERNGPARTEDF